MCSMSKKWENGARKPRGATPKMQYIRLYRLSRKPLWEKVSNTKLIGQEMKQKCTARGPGLGEKIIKRWKEFFGLRNQQVSIIHEFTWSKRGFSSLTGQSATFWNSIQLWYRLLCKNNDYGVLFQEYGLFGKTSNKFCIRKLEVTMKESSRNLSDKSYAWNRPL